MECGIGRCKMAKKKCMIYIMIAAISNENEEFLMKCWNWLNLNGKVEKIKGLESFSVQIMRNFVKMLKFRLWVKCLTFFFKLIRVWLRSKVKFLTFCSFFSRFLWCAIFFAKFKITIWHKDKKLNFFISTLKSQRLKLQIRNSEAENQSWILIFEGQMRKL